jgi:hypothetical protein
MNEGSMHPFVKSWQLYALTWVMVALVAACGEEISPATRLVLVTDTDIAAIDRVEFDVMAPAPDGRRKLATGAVSPGKPAWVVMDKSADAQDGPYLVTVHGLDTGVDEPVITRQVAVSFVAGKTLAVPLHLSAACLVTTCGSTESCGPGGVCEPKTVPMGEMREWNGVPPTLPPGDLPDGGGPHDGGGDGDGGDGDGDGDGDAGSDAMVPPADAGLCSGESCDTSCDDSETGCMLDCGTTAMCSPQCGSSSSCAVNCRDSNLCDVDCDANATCTIDCATSSDCRPTCAAGSTCDIQCPEGERCDRAECRVGARCILRCAGTDCEFKTCAGPNGQMGCNDTVVCGFESCPE